MFAGQPLSGPAAQPVLDPDGLIFGARRALVGWAIFGANVRVEGECWLCLRADRSVGYPCIKIGKKVVDAHRVAFILCNGPIAPGLVVRHTCDVRRCIRPSHLLIGTYQDNHDDMVARGRRASPRRVAATQRAIRDTVGVAGQKLDREKVECIRRMWREEPGHTHASLGVLFGVGRSTIGRIVRNERWLDAHRPLEVA
jgi:hypothetical protein